MDLSINDEGLGVGVCEKRINVFKSISFCSWYVNSYWLEIDECFIEIERKCNIRI